MKSFVKMILPVAAFALASAGAVGTGNSGTESGSGLVQGWKRIAPKNCVATKECNNETQALCFNGADQMYSRPTPTSDCTGILFHRP